MRITGTDLAKMSSEELEELFKNMTIPTSEQKEKAWKKMDTGIYDNDGTIIGDKCADEDAYESEDD